MKKLAFVLISALLLLSVMASCEPSASPHIQENETSGDYSDSTNQESAADNVNADSAGNDTANVIEDPDESVTHDQTNTSGSNEENAPDERRFVRNLQTNFTSAWAKTPEHFFLTYSHEFGGGDYALYRLPLDDITQGNRIAIPGEGRFDILGFDESYLYISRRSEYEEVNWYLRHYEIFRVSLSTLETMLIDNGIYYGAPFYHLASNSIIFAHFDSDLEMFRLEYLQLDSGQRHILFEIEYNERLLGIGWVQMEADAFTFAIGTWDAIDENTDFVFIDRELNAQQISFEEIDLQRAQITQPQSPAEEFIYNLDPQRFWRWSVVTMGDLVYYLWSEDSWLGNLYRINLDGSQNTLLQDDVEFFGLYGINNTLLATMFPPSLQVEGPEDLYHAVVLAEDGSIAEVFGMGWAGQNRGLEIQQLLNTDMAMLMLSHYFLFDAWVIGLYCTRTGAVFNLSSIEI